MQHFFYKLIPPRPDFHLNQTEREKVIMQQHAAYWDRLTAEKKAIVYGPVFHEDGVFGIAVIEVAAAEEAGEIARNDPAVSSKLNIYELSPMIIGLSKTKIDKNMKSENFNCILNVEAPAAKVFNDINHVSEWWIKNTTGASESLDGNFTVHFKGPFVDFKIIDFLPNKRVEWLVTNCDLPWRH